MTNQHRARYGNLGQEGGHTPKYAHNMGVVMGVTPGNGFRITDKLRPTKAKRDAIVCYYKFWTPTSTS